MSHRAEDNYGFVATGIIKTGMVTAFNPGDPVPDSTVESNPSWKKDGLVVPRNEWEDRPADEPERPMERGEMPAHLRDKVASDAGEQESATSRTARAGGSSSKKPDASKTSGKSGT